MTNLALPSSFFRILVDLFVMVKISFFRIHIALLTCICVFILGIRSIFDVRDQLEFISFGQLRGSSLHAFVYHAIFSKYYTGYS